MSTTERSDAGKNVCVKATKNSCNCLGPTLTRGFFSIKDEILVIPQYLLLLVVVNYLTHLQLATPYSLHTQVMAAVNYFSSHS